METIYFFQLIKKNTLLYSILLNGNLNNLDLNNQEVSIWSENAIEISNLSLGEDVFEAVMVAVYDDFMAMDLKTSDAKFFNNPAFYFNRDVHVRLKRPYLLNGESIEEKFKDLGSFESSEFNGPVSITLRHFNAFNYTLSFCFYSKKIDRQQLSKKLYYLGGKEVKEEVLMLFKPDEILLKPTFTPYSYSPIIELLVKDSDHPVLKYFENEGSLFYRNRLYDYGKLPRTKPNEIRELTFVDDWDNGTALIPVLVVNTFKPGGYHREEISVSYDVESPEIKFIKIRDQILKVEQLASKGINLEDDYELVKAVFGKQAVDEFGDPLYAQGIGIYELK